jgi:hypothetical protein
MGLRQGPMGQSQGMMGQSRGMMGQSQGMMGRGQGRGQVGPQDGNQQCPEGVDPGTCPGCSSSPTTGS